MIKLVDNIDSKKMEEIGLKYGYISLNKKRMKVWYLPSRLLSTIIPTQVKTLEPIYTEVYFDKDGFLKKSVRAELVDLNYVIEIVYKMMKENLIEVVQDA